MNRKNNKTFLIILFILSIILLLYFFIVFITKDLLFFETWIKIDKISKDNTTGNFVTLIGIFSTIIFSILITFISMKTQESSDNLLAIEKYRLRMDMLPHYKKSKNLIRILEDSITNLKRLNQNVKIFLNELSMMEKKFKEGWMQEEIKQFLEERDEKEKILSDSEFLMFCSENFNNNPKFKLRTELYKQHVPFFLEGNIYDTKKLLEEARDIYNSDDITYILGFSTDGLDDVIKELSNIYNKERINEYNSMNSILRDIERTYYNYGADPLKTVYIDSLKEFQHEIEYIVKDIESYKDTLKNSFNKVFGFLDK
ncbi:hypothetical protein [Peribacillus frigoritolerans]|uniref:hypothetical protein n=1 Tax=Peribacillus frigoritolerans TaxID=450367 RepID=UPI00215A8CA8|nr:hypothetical protein [Peribacillus frigoritolerans]MCR8870530.1 hypothetical protein [Peribacillus frigoritolerans]